MKNIIPKIIVAFAAVILWFLIVSGQKYVGVIDLPLTIYEPREDMTLGDVLPQTIKVRVEGPGRALYLQKWSKKSTLILDVGNITDEERISLKDYFQERPNQVRLQSEMTFLEVVFPDSIDIMIDTKVDKKVPVEIMTEVSVRPGFIRVGDPDPAFVTLTGPSSTLETINRVRSGILKKENVDASFVEVVPVINPNPELLDMDPGNIEVGVNVEMIGERTIANIPIQVKNQPEDLTIQFIPNTVSLRITGGNNQIQSLTARDFTIYFDYLTQWFPNKNYYTVKITPPSEVLDVIRVVPETIEVVVIRKDNTE